MEHNVKHAVCIYQYSGTCISRSPLYKQLSRSPLYKIHAGGKVQMEPIACAVLAGHLSITATFGGPHGDHYRQVPLLCQRSR